MGTVRKIAITKSKILIINCLSTKLRILPCSHVGTIEGTDAIERWIYFICSYLFIINNLNNKLNNELWLLSRNAFGFATTQTSTS